MGRVYSQRHPERTVLYRVLFHHIFIPSSGWAEMIKKVYEINPLICPKCGGTMRIVSFIEDYKVIDKIIDHLKLTFKAERPPPPQAQRTWIIHGSRLPQIRGTGDEAVVLHCESAVTK